MAETTAHRVRVAWSGWPGGPGVSTFYANAGQVPNLTALRTLWAAMTGAIPGGFTTQIENTGQTVDLATGQAIGTWSTGTVGAVGGGGTGGYAAPCGAVIQWKTGQFVNGREVRGKTFLVPLPANAYDGDGTLTPTLVSSLQTAVNTFVTSVAGSYLVWSRKGAVGHPITSGVVRDRAMVLTSRRA